MHLFLTIILAHVSIVLVNATTTSSPSASPTLSCQTFEMLYKDGKDLCETIFDNSFVYVPVNSPTYATAYTMWWFTRDNPNDAATAARQLTNSLPNLAPMDSNNSQCLLVYDNEFKLTRSFESGMTECQPFAKGCCPPSVVATPEEINQLYGDDYRWDRCGKLSANCERFFVQEACMYQCDSNAGLYRMYPQSTYNASDPNANQWEIASMPIKGDYCDAWYDACRFDKFCADGGGSFFSCARQLEKERAQVVYQLPPGAIAGTVIGSVALAGLLLCVCTLIYKERQGRPLFRVEINEDTPLMHGGGAGGVRAARGSAAGGGGGGAPGAPAGGPGNVGGSNVAGGAGAKDGEMMEI